MDNSAAAAKAAIRNRPTSEQRAELLKLRKEQFSLRLQRVTGQVVKPDQFGKVRKRIARLKTAIRAQAGAAPAVAAKPSRGKK